MALTPERLGRIRTLFEEALERTPEDRSAFLGQVTGDDRELRAEVEALLAAHTETGETFSPALLEQIGLGDAGDGAVAGVQVGPYELFRRIGIGGMGAVYEAVRADDQYRKRVAIKLLKLGAPGELAIRRLRFERQILANLDHPNIAALLDGGVTDHGHPYLVMEYVEGSPITVYCDDRQLGLHARVALFFQVCAAVRHAHQQLVVHRDLKPANIFVTEDGRVKLLDFGIAKLLRDPEPGETPPATFGTALAFTPDYASPEQVRGQAVGTAADIYALGVVLFELLTGRRPFALGGLPQADAARVICETPAPRPSTVAEAAAARGERSAKRLRARLAGDLDAIVSTALRKEPERRYGSVEQFAADLERWSNGHPVLARPDRFGYRAAKFIGRRRLELAAAGLVAVTLLGGVVTTARQAARAEAERARTGAINEFLLTMLGAADPGSLGPDATVRAVLDSAALRADALADQPDLEAEVRVAIGRTYLGLGEYPLAREHLLRALELRRAAAPAGDRATALVLGAVARTHESAGDYATGDSLHQAALAMFLARASGDDRELGAMLSNAAQSRHNIGDLDEAERLQRAAIAARERINGPADPELVVSFNNLALVMLDRGDLAAADSLQAQAVATARLAHGERHPVLAAALGNYAGVLDRRGRFHEADSVLQLTLALRRDLLGTEHPDYAWTLFNHAQILAKLERWAEAATRAREVLALRGRSLPDAHPAVATAMQALGIALARQDSVAEGERWLRQSVALRRAHLPDGHWLVASGEGILGEHLALRGAFTEAEALLLGSEQQILAQLGEQAPQVRDARNRLARLYEAWEQPAEADRWRKRRDGETG